MGRVKRVRETRRLPRRGILLDTHALLWWLAGDERMPPKLRRRLSDVSKPVFVSAATAWEMATKVRLGKLPVAAPIVERLPELLAEQGFRELPISLAAANLAGRIAAAHRDPFDRMLAAQATLEQLDLVSADPVFASLGVKAVW
jgi:PIN domain nuclease of toxin-antitoxin system